MIQTYDINRIFPRFILQDKNGYAIAKALQAGLDYFLARSKVALDTILDVDEMPEWRLDEIAWEYNIPTLGINTELGDEQTDTLIAE